MVPTPTAVRPRRVPEGAGFDHPTLYLNRELGWIDFNWRVLSQSLDPRLPLLERVRFLGITASNLDEFVQKRFGGLRRLEAARVVRRSPDGRVPSDQVELVRSAIREMEEAISETWSRELRPRLLSEAGVRISRYSELTDPQRSVLDLYFREYIYPVLTPLAVDPGHPFPFISNLSLSLGIWMRDPRKGANHFARLKIPTRQGRWIPVPDPDTPFHFIPVEELIRHRAEDLFRGMRIEGTYAFRVIRNADVRRDEEEAEDLVAMIAEALRERRSAPVVRLEVEPGMPQEMREVLLDELELGPDDLTERFGDLALEDCLELADLPVPEHRFPPWEPQTPPRLAEGGEGRGPDIFSVIRRGDLLVHHPYESFATSVQRLVEEAAADPHVLAIKQTLYRTSDDSPIVKALIQAAQRGKEVAVLVEVKARFDEQNNIEWARILENAGVHVTYGVVGLKTHAKVLLIVRNEEGRPRTYCHIGTGNYHTTNARVYTDLGLLTCEPDIASDVVNLFHYLTGHAPAQPYERLIVAPGEMRDAFLEYIRREIAHSEAGVPARIVAKMNALDDPELIQEIYRASQAGVAVDLIVRGHCSLRPGLPGYSDKVRVVSIIGRFLEHDRIFLFHNGGDTEIYIGSADWRGRNLDERVEAITPILHPDLKSRLIELLELALRDNVLAWEMSSEGSYARRIPQEGEELHDLHLTLMEATRRASAASTESTKPHPQGTYTLRGPRYSRQ